MKISGKFQFAPLPQHHHNQPLYLDSSAVKFPGYSALHHEGLLQPLVTPADLDAVITEAKHHRQSKQLAVNFPTKNINIDCAGYSMLGCV